MGNSVRFNASLDDKVSSNLSKIRDNFDRMGKGAASASLIGNVGAKALAGGIGLAAGALSGLGDFIGDSINASRDLGESMSKSRVVFGESAKDIEKFGNTAAESMGLSKQAAIEAAASFGNLFVGLDLGQTKAAEMSQGIVKLAGDLASFNNQDPTEVLQKLRSGLSGEAEPLRSVGVFLTEAKVKAKAMSMGLADAHGELSEGAKVLARYQLILDETGTAQGDFARTSTGLANTQRTATASLIDAQAGLGAAFEPVALQVTNWQIDFIEGTGLATDALLGLGRSFGDVVDAITPWDSATERATKAATEHVNDMAAGYGKAADDMAGALSQPIDAMGIMKDTLDREGMKSVGSLKKVGRSAIEMGRDFDASQLRIRSSFIATKDKLSSNAQDIIDRVFGPVIKADQMWADRRELAAQRAIVASSTSTAAQKRDAAALVTSLTATVLSEQIELLKIGGLSANGQKALMTDLDAAIKKSSGSSRAELIALKAQVVAIQKLPPTALKFNVVLNNAAALSAFAKSLGYIGNQDLYKLRAKGGPINPGELYKVGEHGEEWFVSNKAGTILPHGTEPTDAFPARQSYSLTPQTRPDTWGTAPSGSPVVIQLMLDGRVIAETSDRDLYYRRMSSPR